MVARRVPRVWTILDHCPNSMSSCTSRQSSKNMQQQSASSSSDRNEPTDNPTYPNRHTVSLPITGTQPLQNEMLGERVLATTALQVLGPDPNTRVMSPTQTSDMQPFGFGQGWFTGLVPSCQACGVGTQDPFLCASCGVLGHPSCLGAENFQGIPICGNCFTNIASEYARMDVVAKQEGWRKMRQIQFETANPKFWQS